MTKAQAPFDPRLYVALDLPSIADAKAMVERLGDSVVSYKIGLQLLPIGGVEFGKGLIAQGKNVFFDFKLHDIGATVEKATRSIAPLGASLLTVHGTPDVMAAAVKGRGKSKLKIMAVTVLTSLDDAALVEMGYFTNAKELVIHRVRQAVKAGVDGVISSPLEAAEIRALVPKDFLIVTPGVRMPGGDAGDQKRIATPALALSSGASHIVVGRPITQSNDPRRAVADILKNIRTNS
ncbi:MAG: orotidine-5'-phosphate decarboxylase [Acidimicrobiales bacterium]|nr:orotidine-5'-phosphate decarboxylase [Hyphomonadaceae bacterium]RZV44265.1 MAG: orotidine-5'-phosphate decarboxylase [Acidimicrobiales bacterium]